MDSAASEDLKCREVKTGFAKRDKCKPVLLRLSLAGNLEKPLVSPYWTRVNFCEEYSDALLRYT